jgi:hypothetical protein
MISDAEKEKNWQIIFDQFMEYLSSEKSQKQLGIAEDILLDMLYIYMTSSDKVHIGRAILGKEPSLLPNECDAQLNLEYSVEGRTYVQIRYHKHQDENGICKLSNPESWILEEQCPKGV